MKKPMDPSQLVKAMSTAPANSRCFECSNPGSCYVVCNFGVFVCPVCAGLHRELSHRVKNINASIFTTNELTTLEEWGNEKAAGFWLACIPIGTVRPSTNTRQLRDHLRQKYIDRRFCERTVDSTPPAMKKFTPSSFRLAPPSRPAPARSLTDDWPEDEWNDFVQAAPPPSRGPIQKYNSQPAGTVDFLTS